VAFNILADICKTCSSIDVPYKTINFEFKHRYSRISCNTVNIFFVILSVVNIFTSLELLRSYVNVLRLHLQFREMHRHFQIVYVHLKKLSKIWKIEKHLKIIILLLKEPRKLILRN